MGCYLCNGDRIAQRWDRVRDSDSLRVLGCQDCELVFLSSFQHIAQDFYANSGMHGGLLDFPEWLKETATDDQRRFEYCRPFIEGKRILDFGCGNGGFLTRASQVARDVMGVDAERAVAPHLRDRGLPLAHTLEEVCGDFDVITLFHVLEHLPDPRDSLRHLASRLSRDGQMIIEVPNADDALVRLYDCAPFKNFTYWSCHLFCFTETTLRKLFDQAGATTQYVSHVQRYPLSNHLHWLARGKPGGHQQWGFLDSPAIQAEYEARLAAAGLTDTLLACITFPK